MKVSDGGGGGGGGRLLIAECLSVRQLIVQGSHVMFVGISATL